MSSPQFWLIAGPNGAGKSTMSATIRKRIPSVNVIDPDYIAMNITGSFASVDKEQVAAGKKALSLVKQYFEEGKSFIAESTISGATYLKYVRLARQNGFRTKLIYIGLNNDKLSAERVSKRVNLGGHSIPVSDITRRYPRSLANLKTHIAAFESAHIYDNSERYYWVANYRNGTIEQSSQSIPNWIKSYLP